MKNIHFLGFILWLLASFFSFKLAISLIDWFEEISLVFKIITLIITVIVILFGVYKIPLSFLLLVDKNQEKFNFISSIFSVIGLIGLVTSYLYFGFDFELDNNGIFNQSLTLTFGFFLAIFLTNGFLLFPKSLKKR